MNKRAADRQPPGVPTVVGLEAVAGELVPARPVERSVIRSDEPFVNVNAEAAHVLVETLFAGTHQQIPRVHYAIAYRLAEGGSGGDIVDVFHYDNDQVSFSIADISGKGNIAAVQAAMLKYGLRTLASSGFTAETVLLGLNQLYLENCAFENLQESFASIFFSVADSTRRFLRYANAGHEPVVVVHPNGEVATLSPTGPVVGVFEGQHRLFKQGDIALHHGSLLVATTDGVSEARSHGSEHFGMERLIGSIVTRRTKSEKDIAEGLLADVEAFSVAVRRDDVAILVVRFL